MEVQGDLQSTGSGEYITGYIEGSNIGDFTTGEQCGGDFERELSSYNIDSYIRGKTSFTIEANPAYEVDVDCGGWTGKMRFKVKYTVGTDGTLIGTDSNVQTSASSMITGTVEKETSGYSIFSYNCPTGNANVDYCILEEFSDDDYCNNRVMVEGDRKAYDSSARASENFYGVYYTARDEGSGYSSLESQGNSKGYRFTGTAKLQGDCYGWDSGECYDCGWRILKINSGGSSSESRASIEW